MEAIVCGHCSSVVPPYNNALHSITTERQCTRSAPAPPAARSSPGRVGWADNSEDTTRDERPTHQKTAAIALSAPWSGRAVYWRQLICKRWILLACILVPQDLYHKTTLLMQALQLLILIYKSDNEEELPSLKLIQKNTTFDYPSKFHD